jgi:hypothetical protein
MLRTLAAVNAHAQIPPSHPLCAPRRLRVLVPHSPITLCMHTVSDVLLLLLLLLLQARALAWVH